MEKNFKQYHISVNLAKSYNLDLFKSNKWSRLIHTGRSRLFVNQMAGVYKFKKNYDLSRDHSRKPGKSSMFDNLIDNVQNDPISIFQPLNMKELFTHGH